MKTASRKTAKPRQGGPKKYKREPDRRVQIPTHYPTSGVATAAQAAKFLGCGITHLYKLIGDGSLGSFTEGRKRLFEWSELWRYHNARKQPA